VRRHARRVGWHQRGAWLAHRLWEDARLFASSCPGTFFRLVCFGDYVYAFVYIAYYFKYLSIIKQIAPHEL
jgi:hypothetical protein